MAKRNKEDRQGRAAGKVDKHQAKATKRQWLFFLICALIAGYLIIVKGGGLGVIQKLIPK